MPSDNTLEDFLSSFDFAGKLRSADSQNLGIREYLSIYSEIQKELRYKKDTRNKNLLALWTAIIISLWMLALLFVIFWNRVWHFMSDTVLIALFGTTTATVLGLAAIVLKGYFHNQEKDK